VTDPNIGLIPDPPQASEGQTMSIPEHIESPVTSSHHHPKIHSQQASYTCYRWERTAGV